MVKEIQYALKYSEEKGSFETIIKYGRDSRYYTMIRGWLSYELSGVRSQYESNKVELIKQKRKLKIDFLEKAIRAIDLE